MFYQNESKRQFFFAKCFYISVTCSKIMEFPKGEKMFSDEFMHFLINYQQPSEPPKKINEIKKIGLPKGGKKLAAILLTVKK